MISQKDLKDKLIYDCKSGEFFWIKTGRGRRLDLSAGTINDNGYLIICINGNTYRAHVLAFVYMEGVKPKNDIDHINGNRLDNSFKNLRKVTRCENLKNSSIRSDNKSGVTGVSFDSRRNKWCVRIGTSLGYKNLGYFNNKNEAIRKRKEAEKTYGYHKNHGKRRFTT